MAILNGETHGAEDFVFAYLSKPINKFCRDEGAILIPWYHDEPRWLLRWGAAPLHQIEIRVKGYPLERLAEVLLIPSVFDRRGGSGWRFGPTYYARFQGIEELPWFMVNRQNTVELEKFKQTLQEAFNETNKLGKDYADSPAQKKGEANEPGEHHHRSPVSPKGNGKENLELKKAYSTLEGTLPPEMVSELVFAGQQKKPGLASISHFYDTLRTLPDIKALEERNEPLELWFYHQEPRPFPISPELGGRLLSNYTDFKDIKFEGFGLTPNRQVSICGFDSALRLMAYHIDFSQVKDGVSLAIGKNGNGKINLSVKDIDETAALFIKDCQKDGFIASKPRGRGSIFTTYAAFELAHSLQFKTLKLQESQYAKLLGRWTTEVEEALKKCIVNGHKKPDDAKCAFGNVLKEEPSLAASYYALRTLGYLKDCGEEDTDRIKRFFKENEESCSIKAFLESLKLCWDPNTGGFAPRPYATADILNTRYALQILRTLLHCEIVNQDDIKWFNAPAIVDYVMSCYSHGGFVIKPGNVPLLYTTRAGVNVIKLLEIMRHHQCFDAESGYLEKRGQFDRIIDDIPPFLKRCRDEDKDEDAIRYFDYPLRVTEVVG